MEILSSLFDWLADKGLSITLTIGSLLFFAYIFLDYIIEKRVKGNHNGMLGKIFNEKRIELKSEKNNKSLTMTVENDIDIFEFENLIRDQLLNIEKERVKDQ